VLTVVVDYTALEKMEVVREVGRPLCHARDTTREYESSLEGGFCWKTISSVYPIATISGPL
jgi:hypothetical protein